MTLLFANDRRGEHAPSWYAATADAPGPYPPLKGAHRADVCVVGAGFTGLSAALHLARAGADVVLLDAHRVGWGASGRNGGQVGTGQRQDQAWLERRMGADAARALWDMAEEAKRLAFDLAGRCDAEPVRGLAALARSAASARHLAEGAGHLRRRYGHDALKVLDRDAARALVPARGIEGAVLDPTAGHVHPLRLACGLARLAETAGARIHELSWVHRIEPGRVATDAGHVDCDQVVLAANGYHDWLDAPTAARVLPINNFIVATDPLGGLAETVLTRDIAVHDDRFVVSYWRLTGDRRLLFGGGESYGDRFPRDIAAKVRPAMLALYPQLRDVGIAHAWGGTLGITATRMPQFRRDAGLWVAAGYSGHGVAMALMAGRLIADGIRGDAAGFDLMARVPTPAFPGGAMFRTPLMALAMTWFAARDRLGV